MLLRPLVEVTDQSLWFFLGSRPSCQIQSIERTGAATRSIHPVQVGLRGLPSEGFQLEFGVHGLVSTSRCTGPSLPVSFRVIFPLEGPSNETIKCRVCRHRMYTSEAWACDAVALRRIRASPHAFITADVLAAGGPQTAELSFVPLALGHPSAAANSQPRLETGRARCRGS